jgi:hypothetical protein
MREVVKMTTNKYPRVIKAHGGYRAYFVGIQPLLEGKEAPIYRFPGGDCVVFDGEIEEIIEE